MPSIVTDLFNFMFLNQCIHHYHLSLFFGLGPTLDQNKTGKDAEHSVAIAVTVALLAEEDHSSG